MTDDATIEVTPAMIAAGADAFYVIDLEFTAKETIVTYIYTNGI
jgi:hypothetical protein